MKTITFLFILFICPAILFAQYENFDLSKYKLPDLKRHQLDFELNSNGYFRNAKYYQNDSTGNKIEGKYSDFLGEGEFRYSYYRNTEKFQSYGDVTTFFNYEKVKNKGDINPEEENSDLYGRISANYDFKYFMGRRQWFINAQPDFSISASKEKDLLNNTEYKGSYNSAALGIGGGIGRIERVEDYRQAILILQELEKRGVVNKQISEEEMLEFAALISELKNMRVFDARKRKQADLEAIHVFLVEKGIINQQMDMNYFVGLEDIWVYGALQSRNSGKQLKLSIRPDYKLTENQRMDYNDYNYEIFRIYSRLNYQVYQPLSIKWQANYSLAFNYHYSDIIKVENIDLGAYKHNASIFALTGIGFFPNTRTSLNFRGTLNLYNYSDDSMFDKNNSGLNLNLGTYLYYYISERFRVEGSLSFQNSTRNIFNDDLENSTRNSLNYGLAFSYAIF